MIESSAEGFKFVSRFQVPKAGKGLFFAHPVVCGGRSYVRHAHRLYAYDLKAEPKGE